MNTTTNLISRTYHPVLWFGEREANTAFLLIEIHKASLAVEEIISRVRGGSPDSGLIQNRSTITYRSWGRSLKYNPVVIDFEVSLFAVEETLRL